MLNIERCPVLIQFWSTEMTRRKFNRQVYYVCVCCGYGVGELCMCHGYHVRELCVKPGYKVRELFMRLGYEVRVLRVVWVPG